MEKIYLIVALILFATTVILAVKNSKKNSKIVELDNNLEIKKREYFSTREALSAKDTDLKAQIRSYNTLAKDKRELTETLATAETNYNTALENNKNLRAKVNLKEKDLLRNICFVMDNGEIAHKVKVTTTTNKKGKILKVEPTIRRKVGQAYKEIPVQIKFSK